MSLINTAALWLARAVVGQRVDETDETLVHNNAANQ